MKTASLLAKVVLAAVSFSAFAAAAQSRVFDVRQFGARGDGKTLDTAAIQKALDECGKAGGGTVKLSPGVYLSQPITLRTRTTLLIEEGATLKATDDPKDYLPADVTWDEILNQTKKGPFTPFIGGKDLQDVTITGRGTIDGSGERWWAPAMEAKQRVGGGFTLPRPNLIVLTRCKNLRVSGVTMINAPKFHLVPTECDGVVIEEVTFRAPDESPNTDGIDPSISRNVRITRCVIDVGDDNIAIKSGKKVDGREFASENITVTDCTFLHGHGMSIGSEIVGGVRNLVVSNCTFNGTTSGIRIKSSRERGGAVENLVYTDLTMTNVQNPILITAYYPKIPASDGAQPVTPTTPAYRNIEISNVVASGPKSAGAIVGLPERVASEISLQNVTIAANTGFTIRNAEAIRLKDVKVEARKGAPFLVENAQVEGLPPAQDQTASQ